MFFMIEDQNDLNQNQYSSYDNQNNEYENYYQNENILPFPKKIKIYRWEEQHLYEDAFDFENSEFFRILNDYQDNENNQIDNYQNEEGYPHQQRPTLSRR